METDRVSGVAGAELPLRGPDPARDRVVEEARRRFLQLGFSTVTLDQLAADLGMSKKTLYRFFPDKEALLRAVVHDFQKEMAAGLDAIVHDPSSGFVAKLTGMMKYLAERLSSMNPAAMADIRRHAPRVWQEIEEFRRRGALQRLGRLIREGMTQSYVRDDIESIDLLVTVYIDVIQRALDPELMASLNQSPDTAIRSIHLVMLGGLLSNKGRAALEARRKTRTGFHHQDAKDEGLEPESYHHGTKTLRTESGQNQPPRAPRTPRIRRTSHRRKPTGTDDQESEDVDKGTKTPRRSNVK